MRALNNNYCKETRKKKKTTDKFNSKISFQNKRDNKKFTTVSDFALRIERRLRETSGDTRDFIKIWRLTTGVGQTNKIVGDHKSDGVYKKRNNLNLDYVPREAD